MSGGLVALLDDIAVIARAAAASVDDIGAAAARAGTKTVGVIVDDAAVTPRYVTGFSPARELPIIWKIAKGSLFNKLIIILPVVLALSYFFPAAINYVLMLGGTYLCFEGAEKVYEALTPGHHTEDAEAMSAELSSEEHEQVMVSGAIRTDLILSAEIMAIALAEVSSEPLLSRTLILIVVALLITALVYGVVAVIVKMDDVGLKLAQSDNASTAALGRSLVKGMPHVLTALSVIGTAAMLWVGGHIIIHGLAQIGRPELEHIIHDFSVHAAHMVPVAHGLVEWLTGTIASGLFGLLVGFCVVALLHLIPRRGDKAAH